MNAEKNKTQVRNLVSDLQETLTPVERRGFVDSFLLRKQSDEVWKDLVQVDRQNSLCLAKLFSILYNTL